MKNDWQEVFAMTAPGSRWRVLSIVIVLLTVSCGGSSQPTATELPAASASAPLDPLPSWNDGTSKNAIVEFVARVTREGGPDFVPIPERIATFDNDGTLWSEKPVPFQVVFAFDQVKAMAAAHPEWKTKEPFASVLKGDVAEVAATGEKGVLAVMAATHAGMTTDEFSNSVRKTGSRRPNIPRQASAIPRWSISQCSSC